VDDPAIVAQAKRVRRRDGDPVSVAKRLLQWVADSVRLESTLSPPSAVAALRSRAGDVEHHATLFVALARASGIPARAVSGLLVRDTTVISHAWAEVWLAQEWLPVDPSSGQFPADGGRIRLAEGGIGARPELDRVISRATVRILRTVNVSITTSSR
jgi:transglutaminase-like putative cysteine protease